MSKKKTKSATHANMATWEYNMYAAASRVIHKMKTRLAPETYVACHEVLSRLRQNRDDIQFRCECKYAILSIVAVDEETHDCIAAYLDRYDTSDRPVNCAKLDSVGATRFFI